MRSRSLSVTGATGFVGWHVAGAFLAAGWDVRAIVRRGNRKPVPAGTTIVESDLSEASLAGACAGSDVIVHGAAVVRAPDDSTFRTVNVEGASAAAAAAARVGARLLFVSSQAAGGEGTPLEPRRESDPPAPVNAYGRSKLEAEAAIRSAGGEWTILRPCAVYGPRDRGFLPLFRMARRGLFLVPSAPETAFTLIYIDDLVRAILLAAESRAAIGETLFIGHPEPKTGADVLRAIAASEGTAFRPRFVPFPLFSALAALGDLSWKLGVKPLIDSGRLRELRASGFVCSVERARRVLGFTAQTALDEGVGLTARWYSDAGWV